jgi:hypothetical protein
MHPARTWFGIVAAGLLFSLVCQLWSSGQQPAAEKGPAGAANRIEFEVVESFDAKYLGDTPGHLGRAGRLEGRKLRVALGDPMFRGDERVGIVTGLKWNRTNGSLDIEFDPVDHCRVHVGDLVWMALDGSAAARTTDGAPGR